MVYILIFISLANATATNETSVKAEQTILKLSPEMVVERGFNEGLQATLLRQQLKTKVIDVVRARSRYDFAGRVETQYQENNIESLQIAADKVQNLNSGIGIRKPFSTGTLVSLQYSRRSDRFENPSFLGNAAAPGVLAAYQDVTALELEQSLLNNAFGRADRAEIRASELRFSAEELKTLEDLEESVLNTLRLYWRANIARQNFQESVSSQERYQKLLKIVERKKGLGFANPGELAQIQAELEARNQAVKIDSSTYLELLDQLLTSLNLDKNADIDFLAPVDVPEVPVLVEPPIDSLRSFKALQAQVKAAENQLLAIRSRQNPSLKLFTQIRSVGFDRDDPSQALSEMFSFSRTDNLIGLKLESFLFSDAVSGEVQAARAQLQLSETLLHQTKLQLTDKLKHSQRNAAARYFVAESSLKQTRFREQAVRELTRSYEQGRIDLDTLINALNALVQTQINASRSVGDYHISLNEWASAIDLLVKEGEITNENP